MCLAPSMYVGSPLHPSMVVICMCPVCGHALQHSENITEIVRSLKGRRVRNEHPGPSQPSSPARHVHLNSSYCAHRRHEPTTLQAQLSVNCHILPMWHPVAGSRHGKCATCRGRSSIRGTKITGSSHMACISESSRQVRAHGVWERELHSWLRHRTPSHLPQRCLFAAAPSSHCCSQGGQEWNACPASLCNHRHCDREGRDHQGHPSQHFQLASPHPAGLGSPASGCLGVVHVPAKQSGGGQDGRKGMTN